nr:hypothetical protein [Tanacetum cinerariifolium]
MRLTSMMKNDCRNTHFKCKAKRRPIRLDQEVAAYPLREGVAAAAGETSGGGWGDVGGDGKGVVVGGEGDKVAITVVVSFGGGGVGSASEEE